MLITISLLILAYMIMGKNVKPLLEKVRNIDLGEKIKDLKERMHPWAVKVGRAAARPLLQFYYVMDDGVAVFYVYKKIKARITPDVEAKVEETLNDWFGVEYELVEG